MKLRTIIITATSTGLLFFVILLMLDGGMVLAMGDKNPLPDEDVFTLRRIRMVEEQIASRGIRDDRVLAAMVAVPRHLFIPEEYRSYSYYDQPIPVGFGQTISQPYIVALMTELLHVDSKDTVLEVGTGSGYQAAILSLLAKRVYTIEILEELGKIAAERLKTFGYTNVEARVGDGYHGWPEHAPFDAIIVTAAAEHIPQPLIDQLKPGGRMIIPVGGVHAIQDLKLLMKDKSSKVIQESLIPVRFVPLTRK